MTSLEEYDGTWDVLTAGHLLRRTLFGPKKVEIDESIALGLKGSLDILLDTPVKKLDEPINYYHESEEANTPLGESWVNNDWDSKDGVWRSCFRAWRIDNMLNQEMTIHQKMALFWFNHFAIEANVASDARGIYELSELFYNEGLGSFKILVEKVTVAQSMLIYLNGNTNQAASPNENFARELFELFTVGKGPLIEEGNYTHYTEGDIVAASKVLSGFTTAKNPQKKVQFKSWRHDDSPKEFSSIFDNAVIENNEENEYLDLINMIFENPVAAKYICRKLYRWFVYSDLNDNIETNIIEPLSQTLIANNYNVKPVLRQLLGSKHFFEMNHVGAQIKSPLDYTIGFQRQLEVQYHDRADFNTAYKHWNETYKTCINQNQSVSDPPDVAGWKAYYQEPGLQRLWITSTSLIERARFTDWLMSNNGIVKNGHGIKVDPFTVFDQFINKEDPNEVVRQFVELLTSVEPSLETKDQLKEALIPGLPDFEWTVEYGDYTSDPTNEIKKNAIASKLMALTRSIKNLPQFQLS